MVVFCPIAMDIEVKFDGEEIIVPKPGTDFMLAFRKRPTNHTLGSRRGAHPVTFFLDAILLK